MNITREADYAIRVILTLANAEKDEKISASTIAESQTIPSQFLLKILRKLRKQGLVKSFMGVQGGYMLNRDAEDINLKDVIEAIDGPIYLNRCLLNPNQCNRYPINCAVHHELQIIQDKLIEELQNVNFDYLVKMQYDDKYKDIKKCL